MHKRHVAKLSVRFFFEFLSHSLPHFLSLSLSLQVERLCRKYDKPLVIICGKTKDLSASQLHNVYPLMSAFDFQTSMSKTAECLAVIVQKNAVSFPILSQILSSPK